MGYNKKNEKSVTDLISSASESLGAVSGATLGFIFGGPIGAVAGSALSPFVTNYIKKIGDEVSKTYLGPKEENRIGTLLWYASHKIDKNIIEGKTLRNNFILENQISSPNRGEELIEGFLLSSKRTFEEKKIKYMGNLMANVFFDEKVEFNVALQYLRIAEELTYYHLCLLKFYLDYTGKKIEERGQVTEGIIRDADLKTTSMELLYAYKDLEKIYFLVGSAIHIAYSFTANLARISAEGKKFAELMNLDEIPESDIFAIKEMLLAK